MAWQVFKKSEHRVRREGFAFIGIKTTTIAFSAEFVLQAGLERGGAVTIFVDTENYRLGFKFSKKAAEEMYLLQHTVDKEGRPRTKGLHCTNRALVQSYDWLKAVGSIKGYAERRFEPFKEDDMWVVDLKDKLEEIGFKGGKEL